MIEVLRERNSEDAALAGAGRSRSPSPEPFLPSLRDSAIRKRKAASDIAALRDSAAAKKLKLDLIAKGGSGGEGVGLGGGDGGGAEAGSGSGAVACGAGTAGSTSSWAELQPYVIGRHSLNPLTPLMQQRLILHYLIPCGEYQDLLTFAYEDQRALKLILTYIDLTKNKDVRLAFDALRVRIRPFRSEPP